MVSNKNLSCLVIQVVLLVIVTIHSQSDAMDLGEYKKDLPISNLCVKGDDKSCKAFTLEQGKEVCGPDFKLKPPGGAPETKGQFTTLDQAACKENVCQIDLSTDKENVIADIDCEQKGDKASCTCLVYTLFE